MKKNDYLKVAKNILDTETERLPSDYVISLVKTAHNNEKLFLEAAKKFGSPLYIINETALKNSADYFMNTFRECISNFQPFYAMKCNNHPHIIKKLAEFGFGIDVSSGIELEIAINADADKIIFTGPAKTSEELEYAVEHSDKVTILSDSFYELAKIAEITSKLKRHINIGVRITIDPEGLWKKFGIPLEDLTSFIDEADKHEFINFSGIHFHSSWNMNPNSQTDMLSKIGNFFRDINKNYTDQIKFIDIGGGFWPEEGEWLHSESTLEGKLKYMLDEERQDALDHRFVPSTKLKLFASKIGLAVKNSILPVADCTIYCEPGRWIAHQAMSVLFKIEDMKYDDIAIADAGTNMVGWEKYESDYCPVINMCSLSLKENPYMILGALCTPHDVWGYSYFGDDIKIGDVMVIPNQGAYTYSLRQHFIKAVPKVISFDGINLTEV